MAKVELRRHAVGRSGTSAGCKLYGEYTVSKPQRRGLPAASAPVDVLAARAAEALEQEKFKEAVELFKLVIRQEPRPEWKASLTDAYRGRARTMAAKSMFKEAAMVLENTIALDGTVRDSRLYISCLLRDGQQSKAAAYLLRCLGSDTAVPAAERAALEDLAAALLVTVPQLPEVPHGASSESSRWRELATSSREALAAWINGASAEAIEPQLNRISLRSAFRPIRLLLKSLTSLSLDEERVRQLLATIPPTSAFYPFRQAVEAAVFQEAVLDAAGWERLTPAQQAFVAETRGLPASTSQFLARSSEAAQGGPGALFNFLTKQPDLPRAEVRSACLNLLPHIPDRVPQFEKIFGPLSELERLRVKALAAEARGDWAAVERFWQGVVAAIADGNADRQAMLSQGVVYRHLAHLAEVHREFEGGDPFGDPVIFYLERSYVVDPDHIPTVLELIGHYREASRTKDWHRLVDEAVQRFPDDSQILAQVTESAVARKAYKKAAGFARRLLQINPINPGIRRQMIELQVAQARKQMRAKRPGLAAKELATAAEWERPDAPSGLLRITRGLVGLQTGPLEQAQAWLREGVELAGGGVAGWFRARFEAELMKLAGGDAAWLRKELVDACTRPPTKEAVMTIVSILGQPEARENKRVVAGLLTGLQAWLEQAADLDWPDAEFHTLGETLARFEAFELLEAYARAARKRDPGNQTWRFHHIVARTRGKADRLSPAEMNDLFEMAEAAAEREDFHTAKRIERYLDGNGRAPFGRGWGASAALESMDADAMAAVFAAMMDEMPKGATKELRAVVNELGRDAALAEIVEQMRSAPFAPEIPEAMLRPLCEALVDKAVGSDRPGRRGRARRRQFFDA
jgi:tetratricopeptide (TPR) repeat protein